MLALMKKKKTVSVRPFRGSWLDIGRPDDYSRAIDLFARKKSIFLAKGKPGA